MIDLYVCTEEEILEYTWNNLLTQCEEEAFNNLKQHAILKKKEINKLINVLKNK